MTGPCATEHNSCVGEIKKTDAVEAGKRIRLARELADHMSRDELAALAKIGLSRLGNYEQGLRTLPIPVARQIELATGVPAAFLMGLIDEEEMRLLKAHRSLRRGPVALIPASASAKKTESPFRDTRAPASRPRATRR